MARSMWKQALRDASLPTGRLFHDPRRSKVRNLIRSGVGEKAAMAVSGHRTRVMFDRYNIVGEEETALAFRKLDRYIAAGVPGGTTSRRKGHSLGAAGANLLTANV